VEIGHAFEIKQRLGQGLQPVGGEGTNADFLLGSEPAATSVQKPQGKVQLAFLPALLAAAPKDLAVGHALGEVVEGDAAYGAELSD